MNDILKSWSTPRRALIDELLQARFTHVKPERLAQACQYPLSTGGKRIRALLAVAACESLGQDITPDTLLTAGAVRPTARRSVCQ